MIGRMRVIEKYYLFLLTLSKARKVFCIQNVLLSVSTANSSYIAFYAAFGYVFFM